MSGIYRKYFIRLIIDGNEIYEKFCSDVIDEDSKKKIMKNILDKNDKNWRNKVKIIENYEKFGLNKEEMIEMYEGDKVFFIREIIKRVK